MVVVPPPFLRQHLCLQHAAELLRVEQLVPHLAVERLRLPVLPRRPRLDVQGFQARLGHPGPDRPGHELRTVVAADVQGRAALAHPPGQHRTHRLGRHAPLHLRAGDANLDRYVGNDPTNWVDPAGTQRLRDGVPPVLTVDKDAPFTTAPARLGINSHPDGVPTKEFTQLVSELKKLKDEGVFRDLPKGQELRLRLWLDEVNDAREEMGLPPLASADDINEDDPWMDYGPEAVILVMLKKYGEKGADVLHRARLLNLVIVSDNNKNFRKQVESEIDCDNNQLIVTIAETKGVRFGVLGWGPLGNPLGIWEALNPERPMKLREAADNLYEELESKVKSNWVSEWFERRGRLIISNVEAAFRAAGMEHEQKDLQALKEEWEVQIAVSANLTAEKIKEEARDQVISRAGLKALPIVIGKLLKKKGAARVAKQAARCSAPENVFRGDSNLTSTVNPKGIPKSYLNPAGDLVPANPTGMYQGRPVTPAEHILGGFRRGAKSNSPYTSFTPKGKVAGGYGGQKVTVDLAALRKAIQEGRVKGVEILDQAQVQQAIHSDPRLSDYWKNLASKWAARDEEVLIKGVIPKEFLKVE